MNRYVVVVIAVVVTFLALIVGYTMTQPDGSGVDGAATPVAKH